MTRHNGPRGFCTTTVQGGGPLSYTGRLSGGFPEVTSYDGTNFSGVSNETVVNLDLTKSAIGGLNVQLGGLINIIQSGCEARIHNTLISNPKKIDFNKFVKPTKTGFWKIQPKRTKKSVAIITLISEHFVEMRLL